MSNTDLKTLFYIDDDTDLRTLVQLSLEHIAGYTVKISHSGHNALETLNYFTPDMILLDYHLPDMNGIDVFNGIRQLNQLKNTPVIFMTGRKDLDFIKMLKQLERVDIIIKPFNAITLPEQIKSIWDSYAKR